MVHSQHPRVVVTIPEVEPIVSDLVPNKGSERVNSSIGERGPHPKRCNRRRAPASSLGPSGPRQGLAIKAYRVAPRTRSVSPRSAQEKLSSYTMKFFIVLFAVVAAASAGVIYGHHDPIVQPWVVAPVVHAPSPWVAPAPNYVKIAAPVAYPKHVTQVLNVQKTPDIPASYPSPLNIKLPHTAVTKIHYSDSYVPHPHLVGVEHYVPAPEPAIDVVKAHGHGW
ncbi:hypothetical protein DMN91_005186 [Ooceraea biroi]|uniref:Cuticle protein n=1 Tax=Ooceraea biroi TaxID=2015173 RepID=A0A3L8DT12_OOCBI|nr:uncharacterized protein LOC105287113 isoform X2 [Ooceraea biroi]RLU22908.1 hypothetical protein DMN91_005186 [Ooceraea biroi]